MHEMFLVPDLRVGKQKKCLINTKSYNISTSISTEKHKKYATLDGNITVKVKRSRYRPGVAQRVDKGIALLFHDCCTRRG